MWDWGFKIGRLLGIEIRVHIVLAIMIVTDVLSAVADGGDYLGWLLLSSGLLFVLVLLHEFGHCFAGRAVGGSAEKILMWPLGGLAFVSAPERPTPQLIVAVGGPAVNVAFLLLITPYMLWSGDPFGSYLLRTGYLSSVPSMFFAINLDLLLFNLIPAYPMDGGRIFQCLLWYRMGRQRATHIAATVGMFFGGALILYGLTTGQFFLLFLGLFNIIGSYQARQSMAMVDSGPTWDAGHGYQDGPGGWSMPGKSWWAERKLRKQQLVAEKEARNRFERERMVDELLEKVSREGLQSLTAKEKKFLKEASGHYRK